MEFFLFDREEETEIFSEREEEEETERQSTSEDLPLDDGTLLDRIMEIQKEIDEVNNKEYIYKLRLVEIHRYDQRWDKKNWCLRQPRITKLQQRLFLERDQLVESIPDFWTTALFADWQLLRYINEEERKVFKYLKSVNVMYQGDAKSGYTIQLHFHENNPYFSNDCLTKNFRFSCTGISSRSGTQIKWTKKGRDIEAFAEKRGTQSQTGLPSFFKWFREGSEKLCDSVAEVIVHEFWPDAHIYYFFVTDRCAGKGTTTRARKKLKVETLSKLMTISDELRAAKQEANEERYAIKKKYDILLARGERKLHKKYERTRRSIYSRRQNIIKNIPRFWLIAFSSHYALHHLLSNNDRKILKFLNSVDVEETEDKKGVMSGYTITLKFDKNPYFANKSLTKTISHTVETESPLMEYSDDQVDISVSDIQWKNCMGITTDHDSAWHSTQYLFANCSFFTWFSGLACVPMKAKIKAHDEVADLILKDFWPNAGKYFVNGNLNGVPGINMLAPLWIRPFHL